MSWEEDYRSVDPCPCGKGEVVRTSRSNDWGQSEQSTVLQCEVCREAGYIVVQDTDGKETYSFVIHKDKWAERQKQRELARAEYLLKSEEEERQRLVLDEEVRARLGARFVAALSRLKTKKALWEALKPVGIYIGIQTAVSFHSSLRAVGREEALRRVVTVANQRYIEALIEVGTASSDDLPGRFRNVVEQVYETDNLTTRIAREFSTWESATASGDTRKARVARQDLERLATRAIGLSRDTKRDSAVHRMLKEALIPVAKEVTSIGAMLKVAGWNPT